MLLCMCQAVLLDAHATLTSPAQEMFSMLSSADPAMSAPDRTASVRNRCVWPRCYLLYLHVPDQSLRIVTNYLRQGGYALPSVCLSVCLSVCSENKSITMDFS